MGRKAIDLSGNKYGKLFVIKRAGSYRSHPTWLCKCECGKDCIKLGDRLRSGKTKSCGCITTATHGMSKHPLGGVWNSMIQRCHNPKTRSYKFYGAKGITVCDEWRNSPELFYNWAVPRWKKGLTIDRIDPNMGYGPENCQFITLKENVLRKTVTGKNVGKIFGSWKVVEKIVQSNKLIVECINCKRKNVFEQGNVTSGRCAQCKCSTSKNH